MKKNKERKKEFRGKGKKKIKKKSSVGFKPVRLFLLVSCLCNGRGCLEGLVSLFSLPEPHSSAVVQPLVQFLWVLLLPTRPLVH